MSEKTIAQALSKYYGVDMPDFVSDGECHQWIKSLLNKSNAQLKKCPYCQQVMPRKWINGKLRNVCKSCNKTSFLT